MRKVYEAKAKRINTNVKTPPRYKDFRVIDWEIDNDYSLGWKVWYEDINTGKVLSAYSNYKGATSLHSRDLKDWLMQVAGIKANGKERDMSNSLVKSRVKLKPDKSPVPPRYKNFKVVDWDVDHVYPDGTVDGWKIWYKDMSTGKSLSAYTFFDDATSLHDQDFKKWLRGQVGIRVKGE